MADLPKSLTTQIERLEELFTVPAEKLKEITNHFVSELERGLREENATIVSAHALLRLIPSLTQTAHERDLVHGVPRRA